MPLWIFMKLVESQRIIKWGHWKKTMDGKPTIPSERCHSFEGKGSLHTSQATHQARAYPSFYSMKQLRIFLTLLDGMLVHCRVTPSIKFASNHLYKIHWYPFVHLVERDTETFIKCHAHVRTQHQGWTPGPLNLELSALTMRPPCLRRLEVFYSILETTPISYNLQIWYYFKSTSTPFSSL